MDRPTDNTIIRRAINGHQAAFVELAKRYHVAIAALIRRQVTDFDYAEDILQETLLQAWLGLRTLRDPQRVKPWLLQIARNRCRDFLKSSQRRDTPIEAAKLEQIANRYGRHLRSQGELRDTLISAMAEIDTAERDAADLFYLQGFSIAEIAQLRSCPVGTVKRCLHDARDQLRQMLGVERLRFSAFPLILLQKSHISM